MKRSQLRQIIKEEIKNIVSESSLDPAEKYWPIPSKWFNKYYTMDFYPEGPRIFQNDNGEFTEFSDVVKHYESENGPITNLF
jgi:hypothetical protein